MEKNYLHILLLITLALAGCTSSREITTAPSEPVAMSEATASTAETTSAKNDGGGAIEVTTAPDDWYLDEGNGGALVGIGVKQAYATLLEGKSPKRKVVVAVIDSGIDIDHEDLESVIWTNEDEIPDNGIDDDANGYIDDVHGWNFIGGPDGRHVDFDTFEITREYVKLRNRYADADPDALTPEEQAYYERVQKAFEDKVNEMVELYNNFGGALELLRAANSIMADALGKSSFTIEEVMAFASDREDVQQAKSVLAYFDQIGFGEEEFTDAFEEIEGYVQKGLNPEFDPRAIVGDNYDDLTERYYGNNDVEGPDPHHGTHVAGIIAASRGNGIGVDGIAGNVEIMPVRAVPNGDERDKDVANAIRYAVDNGAAIINMSFGKAWSPQKHVVDEAVKYAESKNVLMIHAAGNDGVNIDSTANYPASELLDGGGEVENWIEVGASSWQGPNSLAASFSNYGQEHVDVFAPGVSIYSTIPGNAYDREDGTSMASPVVTGLAALVMSYYPELTAGEVKDILMKSAVSYSNQAVLLPGSEETMVLFGSLSRSGAIVNAYEALKLAEIRSGM